jgi:hypothetical protein
MFHQSSVEANLLLLIMVREKCSQALRHKFVLARARARLGGALAWVSGGVERELKLSFFNSSLTFEIIKRSEKRVRGNISA